MIVYVGYQLAEPQKALVLPRKVEGMESFFLRHKKSLFYFLFSFTVFITSISWHFILAKMTEIITPCLHRLVPTNFVYLRLPCVIKAAAASPCAGVWARTSFFEQVLKQKGRAGSNPSLLYP